MKWWDLFVWGYATDVGVPDEDEDDNIDIDVDITITIGDD